MLAAESFLRSLIKIYSKDIAYSDGLVGTQKHFHILFSNTCLIHP
jgi:hypothetical protein